MGADDDRGVIMFMATAFVLGIIVVWRRYEDMRNRAVPFHWPAPEVSSLSFLIECSDLTIVNRPPT